MSELSVTARRTFPKGAVIIRQGEEGGSAYIIEQGRVVIRVEDAHGRLLGLGTRGPGTLIGEMALMDDAPRMATIWAEEDCVLSEITREDFLQRLKATDPVVQAVAGVILARYREFFKDQLQEDTVNQTEVEKIELAYTSQARIIEYVTLTNDLQAALKQGQLYLCFQPIVELRSGELAGFEALVRWNHPEHGEIPPDQFIAVAEQSALIVALNRWVFGQACMALRRMEDAYGGERPRFMSVNFSSVDFSSDQFVPEILQCVRDAGLQANQVRLEITERVLIEASDQVKVVLRECRRAGLHIAMDDFGTGYSSMGYLHRFQMDTLKIDQTFIRSMLEDKRSLGLVKSMIVLAKNLELNIVAEGVEQKEQAVALAGYGCQYGQGYYFSKPLPELEILALLRDWSCENHVYDVSEEWNL